MLRFKIFLLLCVVHPACALHERGLRASSQPKGHPRFFHALEANQAQHTHPTGIASEETSTRSLQSCSSAQLGGGCAPGMKDVGRCCDRDGNREIRLVPTCTCPTPAPTPYSEVTITAADVHYLEFFTGSGIDTTNCLSIKISATQPIHAFLLDKGDFDLWDVGTHTWDAVSWGVGFCEETGSEAGFTSCKTLHRFCHIITDHMFCGMFTGTINDYCLKPSSEHVLMYQTVSDTSGSTVTVQTPITTCPSYEDSGTCYQYPNSASVHATRMEQWAASMSHLEYYKNHVHSAYCPGALGSNTCAVAGRSVTINECYTSSSCTCARQGWMVWPRTSEQGFEAKPGYQTSTSNPGTCVAAPTPHPTPPTLHPTQYPTSNTEANTASALEANTAGVGIVVVLMSVLSMAGGTQWQW
jgi:hypothetical protein